MVCTQLVVSGDVCTIQLSCGGGVCLLEVYTTVSGGVYTTVRVMVCVYRSVVNVSVMVCTQLVVSGDVCV